MTTIAVTGATGQLGRLAIAALKARGAQPIALARTPEKAADLGVRCAPSTIPPWMPRH